MDDDTAGPRDRYPGPGMCNRGTQHHWEVRVYRYGDPATPTLLCRRHLVELIKVATWPHPPRNLGT